MPESPEPESPEPEPRESRDRTPSSGWPDAMRFAGAGLELAGSTLVLGAVGYGIDAARGHQTPFAALTGLLLGFAAGLYRLIALAMKTLSDDSATSDRPPDSSSK